MARPQIHRSCFWILATLTFLNALPTELDPFLGVLFETSECEDFLGNADFLSVATTECAPYHCDFPRQLCMRPSLKLTDESTNQCREIPEKCLTAANGGVSLHKAGFLVRSTTSLPKMNKKTTPSPIDIIDFRPEKPLKPEPEEFEDICEMEQPQGRFCGFQLKFAYNRENRRCEQFWFPGCKTAETNANLFDTEEECVAATYSCFETRTSPAVPETTTRTTTTTEPPFVEPPRGRPIFSVKPPKETPPSILPSPLNIRNFITGGSRQPFGGGTDFFGRPSKSSPKGDILNLITNGLSQFTNSGGPDSETGGNFLENFNLDRIPELIKTLQASRG